MFKTILEKIKSFTRFFKFFLKMPKFSDAGIQDISMSISIKVRIQKNLNDLTDRCDGDESDKHLEAPDHRYSCLKLMRKMIG